MRRARRNRIDLDGGGIERLRYWSHDIGGFHNGTVIKGFAKGFPYQGDENPSNATQSEMYLRWLQFGTFSPIFRTHCQCEPIPQANICRPRESARCTGCERRIWKFMHFEAMKDAMVLRNGLAPYIYTQARLAVSDSISLVHPLYYDSPEDDAAYGTSDTQYMFGADIVVAPIAAPAADPVHGKVSQSVWLPRGVFTDWAAERTWAGPTTVTRDYTHAQIPAFVRAGALVPMKTMQDVASTSPGLEWNLFAPRAGGGRGLAYEDDGETRAYQARQAGGAQAHAVLQAEYGGVWASTGEAWFTVATTGAYTGAPGHRWHALRVRGLRLAPTRVTVNGVALADLASAAATAPKAQPASPAPQPPAGVAGYRLVKGADVPGMAAESGASLYVNTGALPWAEFVDVRIAF